MRLETWTLYSYLTQQVNCIKLTTTEEYRLSQHKLNHMNETSYCTFTIWFNQGFPQPDKSRHFTVYNSNRIIVLENFTYMLHIVAILTFPYDLYIDTKPIYTYTI